MIELNQNKMAMIRLNMRIIKGIIIIFSLILILILSGCNDKKDEVKVTKEIKVTENKKQKVNKEQEIKVSEEKEEEEVRPEGAYLESELPEITVDPSKKVEIRYGIVYVDGVAKYFDVNKFGEDCINGITDAQMWLNWKYRKKFKSPVKNFTVTWLGNNKLWVYDQFKDDPRKEDYDTERIYIWKMKGFGLYISEDGKWWYPVEFKLISDKKRDCPYFPNMKTVKTIILIIKIFQG